MNVFSLTARRIPVCIFATLLLGSVANSTVSAQKRVDSAQLERMRARAVEFLRQKGQAADGSFSAQTGPGVTSLVVASLLRSGVPTSDPMVKKGLAYIEKHVQPGGGIHRKGTLYRNYETCLAVMCFAEANKDGRYDKVIRNADRFIKGIQWGEAQGKGKEDLAYGGAGYGKHNRPDMSNTTFMIEALKAAGNGPDSEAIQRALVFISRCQNHESSHNTTKFAAKNPDGGFYYTIAAGGSSQAGKTDGGGLRSYASMTYAGLKSMIFAGVKKDDPRVKAAVTWLQSNYDLKSNPGMGDAGLYYYYHTFAKALDAAKVKEFVDKDGNRHNWRAELVAELASRQSKDGSWVNKNERWLEGEPNLVIGYALLALSYCD